MSIARRLLGTSALVLGGSLWSRLCGAVVVIWLGRRAGVEAFGAFAFVQSYLGIVLGLAEIGLAQIVVREVAKDRPDADLVVGNAVGLRLGVTIPILVLASAGLLALSDAPGVHWMALAGGFWIAVAALSPVQAIFRARIRMGIPVAVNAVATTGYAVVGIVAVTLVAEAWPVYVSFALSNALALGVLVALGARALRPVFRFDREIARSLLVASLPLALNTLLMVVYHRIDQVMLQAFLGEGEVGAYASSVKLVELWNVVPLAVMTGVFPALSRFAGQDRARYDDLLRRTAQLLAIVVLGSLPFVWAHGEWMLVTLFGEDFRRGASVLGWLMTAELFLYFLFVFRDALVSDGRERIALAFSLVTMISNVGLNIVLIPAYGIDGAAWATLLALASVIVLAALLPVTRGFARLAWRASWRPGLGAVVAAAVLAWPGAPVFVTVPAAALAFVVAIVLLGAFDATDRALLAAAVDRVRRRG